MTDVLRLFDCIFTPSYHYSAHEFYGLILNWRLFQGKCLEYDLLEHIDEYECGTEIEIDAQLSQMFHCGGSLRGFIIIDSVETCDYSVWANITGTGVGQYKYEQSEYWKKHSENCRAGKCEHIKLQWNWTWEEFKCL